MEPQNCELQIRVLFEKWKEKSAANSIAPINHIFIEKKHTKFVRLKTTVKIPTCLGYNVVRQPKQWFEKCSSSNIYFTLS